MGIYSNDIVLVLRFREENVQRDCSVSFTSAANWKQRARRRLVALRVASSRLESHADVPAVGHLGPRRFPRVALSQESSGRKEAAQQISSQGWQDGKDRRARTPTRPPRRRQNVKAGSGRQLLVLPVLSAWRRPPNWLASGGPNAFKFT